MKLVDVTSIQVADETFVAAAPSMVAAEVSDRANWRRWWPDLGLSVTEDRGAQGVRWQVGGPLTGTMEIWCEPVLDGFVLHYFLHAEPAVELPASPRARADRLTAENHRRRVAGKAMSFEVKDRLEAGRIVGGPAVGADAAGQTERAEI
ncbi:hypothetical protein [Gordonia rhizosphera]|uniref:Polyketide cyclase / dehydrase and lipid transport n=1 Tax=Gordonia rhizosphera NBRC 16068 TaxID=1108045 RepID=K6VU51_9ACTN|nr:hypothetical protein [Gordonia rhizosphera]GAB90425.1 hypothetical protein GORHZ_102_00520 [Gordonia rhizosphera NBRC 16068]